MVNNFCHTVPGKVVPEGWAVTAQPSGTPLVPGVFFSPKICCIPSLSFFFCFVDIFVELGPGCHAQSRFSKTVLFNGVYYCKQCENDGI